MKTDNIADNFLPGETLTGCLRKVDVVGKTLDGGFHVDLTLSGGIIIEAMVAADKLKILNERVLEDVFFVVKPLTESNRYECTCMVFGKAPEFKH